MTTLLVDADLLLYKAASASESVVKWDDDLYVLHGNLSESIDLFRSMLDGITNALASKCVILCLSDRENFRKDLTPSYKSKRKETRKPLTFKPLTDWVQNNYDPITKKRLEADDVIGILATKNPDWIVVSEDKDLQTIPCHLYRNGELKTVTPDEAEYFWMLQTLMGDSTDGYQGCPGVGPKTAEKILARKPYWPNVVNAYRKAGLTEDDAILNARLARILRHDDWDSTTQEVKLWNPKPLTPPSSESVSDTATSPATPSLAA